MKKVLYNTAGHSEIEQGMSFLRSYNMNKSVRIKNKYCNCKFWVVAPAWQVVFKQNEEEGKLIYQWTKYEYLRRDTYVKQPNQITQDVTK
jgi:hypothetical protein